MIVTNFNKETGWADIEHEGNFLTVRISDFKDKNELKNFVISEIHKSKSAPEMKFTITEGEDL